MASHTPKSSAGVLLGLLTHPVTHGKFSNAVLHILNSLRHYELSKPSIWGEGGEDCPSASPSAWARLKANSGIEMYNNGRYDLAFGSDINQRWPF